MKQNIKNWLQQNWFILLVLGISALLFNFIIPSYYSKLTWQISDIVVAIVSVISILSNKTDRFYIEKKGEKRLSWSRRHPGRVALNGLGFILISFSINHYIVRDIGNSIFGTTILGKILDTFIGYFGTFIIIIIFPLGCWCLFNALFNIIRNKIQKNEKRIKIEDVDEDEYNNEEKEEWIPL